MERAAREALDGRNREQRLAATVSVSALALAVLMGLAWSIHRLTGTPSASWVPWVGFLWAPGAFTTLLMLDDLFLLHEGILPGLTGLPEIVFVCAYPLLFLAILFRHATTILEVDWSLVLITGTLLGASMGIDTVWDSSRRAFAEDALKLAGILTWLLFLARALRTWLSPGALPRLQTEG